MESRIPKQVPQVQVAWLPSNASLKANKGYTLVELVLVIALLGILGALALPKFFTTTPFTNRFYADDLRTSLRYAERYAVGTGCHTQVTVTASQVILNRRAACTSGAFTSGVVDPADPASSTYTRTAPSDVTQTTGGGVWPFYFDALGSARQVSDNAIANFTVTVDSRTVTVYGMTGYVE